MTARCPHAPNGCNYPEGDCLGICANTASFPRRSMVLAHEPIEVHRGPWWRRAWRALWSWL